MRLDTETLPLLREALERLERGFDDLPDLPDLPGNSDGTDTEAIRRVLLETADRLRDNYPYFHPLYAGQMLKPPHPVARLAYALAMWINPNNHALDGGRASSAMEKEAVAELATLFGWKEHLGHLTGGGTMANFEALWAASRLSPGAIVASETAHYTHTRLSEVLGVEFRAIPADDLGRMDMNALESALAAGGVGTVVATLGTTLSGSVDPLPAILKLKERYGFRLHLDMAYGGYFTLASDLAPETRAAYDRVAEADSLVIDPHKHGLQPYGCGCILYRDPAVGALYRHDSPNTYFTSTELHLGEISLECSRPGASAVALWATHRLLPPRPGGEFAAGLDRGMRAARDLHARAVADDRFLAGFHPELDIVVFAPRAGSASAVSAASRRVFEEAGRRRLHLAVAVVPAAIMRPHWPDLDWDSDQVTCLRSVLMKPEHEDWVDRIWNMITAIVSESESGTESETKSEMPHESA